MGSDAWSPKRRTSIGSRPIHYDAYAKMSTPQKAKLGRRYRRAVRVVPRALALVVALYAAALLAYFGKYRVRPRHHTAPDLPAVLREGEIETSSARRLLCSAEPLRRRDPASANGGDDRAASSDADRDAPARGRRGEPIKRGRFLGAPRAFQPPPDREPLLNATDARVFLLTGASAASPGAADLLDHFLDHYVRRGGVPGEYVLVVVHTRGDVDDEATRNIVARLEARQIFHEVWQGEALLFSTVAHRWEHHLAAAADDSDWVVVADLDEHVAVPGDTVPGFLGKVDQMGYALVHGAWVDRLADGGVMANVPSAAAGAGRSESMAEAFPLQCAVGFCADPHHAEYAAGRGDFGGSVRGRGRGGGVNTYALHGLHHYSTVAGVVGGGQRVFAHRAQFPILDVRTLQDFGVDDVVTAARLMEDHAAAYPIPLKVHHYQWTAGAEERLRERANKYEACNLVEQEETSRGLATRLRENGGVMSPGVCPEVRCTREGGDAASRVTAIASDSSSTVGSYVDRGEGVAEETPADADRREEDRAPVPIVGDGEPVGNGGAPRGYGAERRVLIFASVWEHVDGVSRTMKRLAHHLKGRADSQVFVMSPDLVEADYREAAASDRFHVADVPHIPMPGRGEYKMAAPLQTRQRHQLETFAPHVVHVAAPDMLGHSAVRWAAENGVCSVCSYHTAYDTYLQFYRVGMLATPLRQMLQGFYSSCDVVATPSYAAAEHLTEMGVPRERMGFFPRGVNLTQYSPKQRSLEFRANVFGVGSGTTRGANRRRSKTAAIAGTKDGEVVILWVARIVREKGLGSFVRTAQELFRRRDSGELTGLPPFRVVVAGDGPDLPWTRRQLEGFPEVRILGHTGGDRLSLTYAAGDVFFFPSRTEVFPNNLIEAMASGLPVVTDDVGINRAIVKDDVTGVLVKGTDPIPGDVSPYVDALAGLLRDSRRRDALGAAARKSTHGLTWERTFASLRRSYDRCRPGRPYARHMDPNIPGSKAAYDAEAEARERTGVAEGSSASEGSASEASESSSGGMSISGALLGISAQAAGGGTSMGALAAASAAIFSPHHHARAAHHSTSAAAAAAAAADAAAARDDPEHPEHDPDAAAAERAAAEEHPERVPGSGPGAVNRGGVGERDVIVDDGAPPGSLLYRVSYGMTGGYVRSLEDARADDEAIAAAEAAAREAAAGFAASGGRWGGGGALGGGPGFEVGGFYANTPEKY